MSRLMFDSIICRLLCFALLALGTAVSCAQETGAVDVRRIVLSPYDPAGGDDLHIIPAHEYADMPLNHLGLRMRFVDVAKPLPAPVAGDDVRGVLVWLNQPLASAGRLIRWLHQMLDADRRVVVIGDIVAGNPPAEAALLRRLGVRYDGQFIAAPLNAKVMQAHPSLVNFELQLRPPLPPYQVTSAIAGESSSLLRVGRDGRPKTHSDVIIQSEFGVYVNSGYTHFVRYMAEKRREWRRWHINPFELFERGFRTESMPRIDATTLAGRRIYYSHIDGDGWRNRTWIPKYRDQKPTLSAEVIQKEIIEPFPDFPVTVAPVTADLDKSWFGTDETRRIARELMRLAQVEAGTHTHSHPFKWEFFENYSAEKEAPFLKRYEQMYGAQSSAEQALGYGGYDPKQSSEQTIDIGTYSVPRSYGNRAFDLNQEIQGSVDIIESLSPPGKSVALLQWSGNCRPFERAIAATSAAGMLNVNGGDSRFDSEYNSHAWVSPMGLQVGEQIQVYASNSNENTYTELWTRRFFGQRYLLETFKNTELPRRLKPANLYYHMYSGEREGSLRALREIMQALREQELIPIHASHFAAIGKAFFEARLEKLGAKHWRLHERGRLQTVRFDQAQGLFVDPQRSIGVLGSTRHEAALYVALDESAPNVEIALREDSVEWDRPYLVSSRWHLWNFEHSAQEFRFRARGFGAGEMHWQVTPGSRWRVALTLAADAPARAKKAQSAQAQIVLASVEGALRFDLPALTDLEVEVRLTRTEAANSAAKTQ